uniref:Glycosyl transferase, group 2 n=1 Tax=uncultured Flavobacteriia bacterium TaxID=212695 RepID=H6RDU4_9BACT|nr:glycosyl transferase family GT2/GT21 [uncultured bacterium]CCF99205.1 glycosyl transferase, group 2 [uncultured Flavobacteriia bacterium]
MIVILGVLLMIYCLLITALCVGFISIDYAKTNKKEPKTTFSICIPFRNEAENLPALLDSLSALNYTDGLFEIIFVDDHSNDNSVEIITKFCQENAVFQSKMTLLNQKSTANSGKKAALSLAVQRAKNDYIVTTDADCIVPQDWLVEFNAFIINREKKFVAAPVMLFETSSSFLNLFQQLDFFSLQGATIGGFGIKNPFLCNGANLAFSRSEFFRLGGYTGNQEIASGDDLFLMQKFLADDSESTGYLKSKNSIVTTQPQESWRQLINQRKRWAAKASKFKNPIPTFVSWTVFLANIALVLAVFYLKTSVFLSVIVIFKILIDFLLIALAASFFGKKGYLLGYLVSFLVYPFFTLYIAVSSQLQTFDWKGRRFKK